MLRYVADDDFHGTCRVLAELANAGRLELIAAALCRSNPCARPGKITADNVAIALGEAGNLWPDSLVLPG